MNWKCSVGMAVGLFAALVAEGDIRLGKPFGDGMVLQRERTVPIWGTAAPGSTVTVAFAGQSVSATADGQGTWRVSLAAMPAAKDGRVLTVSDGSSQAVLEDVLVGEVWLASGQSNMEFPIASPKPRWCDDLGPIVAQVTHREKVRYRSAGGKDWEKLLPQTLSRGEKSALAVYFAMELEQALDVPVGIVVAAVGGTLVEEWYAGGRRHEQLIKALGPFAIRGVIWYQGEGNLANFTKADLRFGEKLRRLHGDWAAQFENQDLRFDYVQIAPHVHDYGRKIAQLAPFMEGMGTFAADDARASMTVISDLGSHMEIHPRHKMVVAKRLALHALKRDYGYSEIVADSPKPLAACAEADGKVVISFSNVKSLSIYHDERTYDPNIDIRDGNGVWHPATIKNLPSRPWEKLGMIGGSELVVAAPGVTSPTGVRHLYQDPYRGCLYNEVNLPAGPFCLLFSANPKADDVMLCDWIESSGEQVIRTGIVPGPDTSLEIDFATSGFAYEASLFATGVWNQHQYVLTLRNDKGSNQFCWFGDYRFADFYPNRHLKLTVDSTKGKLTFYDGETGQQLAEIASADFRCDCGRELSLFGQNDGSKAGKYRIYGFKITQGGTLVRDFVPGYDSGEKRYGLFDRVSGNFFGADGLLAGPMKDSPPKAAEGGEGNRYSPDKRSKLLPRSEDHQP